jgi:uncharacterized membrane protein
MSRGYFKGIIAGASLMYYFDPDRGTRRRSLLRDQLVHLSRKLERGLDAAARDGRNRSIGVVAKARRRFSRDDAPDVVVEERVRSQLGRVVSHSHAIGVLAREGRVTLTGPVSATQVERLLVETRRVPGVREIENRLDIHPGAGEPSLQGNGRRPQPRSELMQENWTPSLRAMVGGLGLAFLADGKRRSGITGGIESVVGGALAARAASNLPTRRLVGVNAGRRAVRLQKTIHVDAPVEDVWALWSHFESFPRFMAHLEEVWITGEGRSHWVARGPAGTRFEWDAEITQWAPEEVIAWRSVEGATVASAGVVHFQPVEDGGTRIDVHLSYNPPAGAAGHVIASLFGSDPKRAMDEDMVRLKSLLEVGKASVSGKTVTREGLELEPASGAAA